MRYQRTAHRITSAVNCRPLNSLPCLMTPAPPSALSRRPVYPIRTRLANLQQIPLKSTLLKAESIAYSKIGASGVFFADLIQRLGIAEEVNAKARIIPSGFTAELVASGEAELAVQEVRELMVVPGIEVVARLPSDVQSVTTFSAGLFTGSAHREAAMCVLEILSSHESAPILRASGLDPVARDRAS